MHHRHRQRLSGKGEICGEGCEGSDGRYGCGRCGERDDCFDAHTGRCDAETDGGFRHAQVQS